MNYREGEVWVFVTSSVLRSAVNATLQDLGWKVIDEKDKKTTAFIEDNREDDFIHQTIDALFEYVPAPLAYRLASHAIRIGR